MVWLELAIMWLIIAGVVAACAWVIRHPPSTMGHYIQGTAFALALMLPILAAVITLTRLI